MSSKAMKLFVTWSGVTLTTLATIGVYVGRLHASPAQTQSSSNANLAAASTERALLDKYCVTCHNERTRTAGLLLDKIDVNDVAGGAKVWEKVLHKVRTGEMPPIPMPRPDNAALDGFTSWLETSLDRASAAHPNPALVTAVHRLNQAEYTNAIERLTRGLKWR